LAESGLEGAQEVWKTRAPTEYWFFIWLAFQDRC
jgi:hypothetical protein